MDSLGVSQPLICLKSALHQLMYHSLYLSFYLYLYTSLYIYISIEANKNPPANRIRRCVFNIM